MISSRAPLFHSGTPVSAFPGSHAAASTQARLLSVALSAHFVSLYQPISSFSKAAGHRPHRWIPAEERNRQVPPARPGDAPLGSYRGLNIARSTATQSRINCNRCIGKETRAAGPRRADSRRVCHFGATKFRTSAQRVATHSRNFLCASYTEYKLLIVWPPLYEKRRSAGRPAVQRVRQRPYASRLRMMSRKFARLRLHL